MDAMLLQCQGVFHEKECTLDGSRGLLAQVLEHTDPMDPLLQTTIPCMSCPDEEAFEAKGWDLFSVFMASGRPGGLWFASGQSFVSCQKNLVVLFISFLSSALSFVGQ